MADKEKIVIWGTGNIARQFYYREGYKYDIQYFIDNHKPKYRINYIPVYYPDEVNLKNNKIIIAIADWYEVAGQLEKMGLTFHKDYLPSELLHKNEIPIMDILERMTDKEDIEKAISDYQRGRKVALINGNCQTTRIRMYLQQNREFNKEYVFLDIPALYMLSAEKVDLLMKDDFILRKIELFISQNISAGNAFDYRLSNEYLIGRMNKNVTYIRISNLFFDIYFPQGGKEQDPAREDYIRDIFPYDDAVIDELVTKAGFDGNGYTAEEIVEIICMENLFTADFLEWVVRYRIEQLREREALCDVKMLDYIENNWLKEQLFYSRNHPVNKLLKEESVRILKAINSGWKETKIDHEETIPPLAINQEFMYPAFFDRLKPDFTKEWYSDTISECRYTLEEEVRKYLFCCHNR